MIYIRVDANHSRGMGHLYRMLTLADTLASCKQPIKFVIRGNDVARKTLDARGIDYLLFPVSMDEEKIIKMSLGKQESLPALWIFDCLDTDAAWIRLIKEKDIKVICFDDEKGGLERADLVINSLAHRWGGYKSEDVKVPILEGLNYAIINPSAVKYRKRRVITENKSLSVGITMGGSDTHGVTPFILKTVADIFPNKYKFYIFAGPHFLHRDKLSLVLNSVRCDIVVRRAVWDLHKELDSMDIVICAGGITLLEMCVMGLPALTFANGVYEEKNIDHLLSLNACLSIGSISNVNIGELKAKISAFLPDIKLLNEVAGSAMRSVTDGTSNCTRAVLNLFKDIR